MKIGTEPQGFLSAAERVRTVVLPECVDEICGYGIAFYLTVGIQMLVPGPARGLLSISLTAACHFRLPCQRTAQIWAPGFPWAWRGVSPKEWNILSEIRGGGGGKGQSCWS